MASPARGIASDRNVARLALLAVALSSAVLVFHALAVVPSTDDFCNRLAATAQSLPGAVADSYREWTGRVLTTTLLYAALASLDLFGLWPIALPIVAAFVGSAFAIARFSVGDGRALRTIVAAFALAAMMLGLQGLVAQTLFWVTGGIVYMVSLLLLTAWVASMRTLVADGRAGSGKAGGFAFGVLVGNAIELAVPIALAYGTTLLWTRRSSMAPRVRSIACWRLAGVVAGAALLALAPGNRVRAQATPTLFDAGVDAASELASALTTGASVAWPLMLIAVIVAAGAWLLGRGDRIDRGRRSEALAIVAGGAVGLLPVLVVPAQFTSRNLLFLLVACLAAALLVAAPVLARVGRARQLMSLVAFVLSAVMASTYVGYAREAWALRERIVAQDRTLREAAARGEREVALAPIGVPPRTVHFIELANDASRWDNRCVARYYGLQRVWRTGPDR